MSRAAVAIVGGGITGLAAAWELQCRGIDYVLLEGSYRLGGKIMTERIDGYVIEGAADSFLTQKPWAEQLAREIGLGDRLIGTNPSQRAVYVLRHGALQPMPRGMRLVVPLDPEGLLQSDLISAEGKRRMLAERDIPPRLDFEDESLAQFVRRRFGDEAEELFGDSILAGIHVGDAGKLSVEATYPQYRALERDHGSVIRGMAETSNQPASASAPRSMFASFPTGMIELIDGLRTHLHGEVRLGAQVTQIEKGTVTVGGERISVKATILAVPARSAAAIVPKDCRALAEGLQVLRVEGSAVVTLAFKAEQIGRPLDGYGFVVPATEPVNLLACTWSSTKLGGRAPAGCALLRVFFGGPHHAADLDLSDQALVDLAMGQLRPLMDLTGDPLLHRVNRWRDANPQYDVGHLQRLAALRSACPPWLRVTGCAYGGVGIPDCVRQGREAAIDIVHTLQA